MYVILSTLSAIFSTHQSCIIGTVLWSISKSTCDPKVVHHNIVGARKRATFPLFLPRGVTLQRMEWFWHRLQFNPAAPVEVPFKAELFRPPPRGIRSLRLLAGKGRRRLKRSIRSQKGRPKLVLGIPNDAQKVAPLLALAHGSGLVQTVGRVSRSDLDAVDKTTIANLSENQERTTRKAKNPQRAAPIDTGSQPSRSTKQTTQVHAVPKVKSSQRQNRPLRRKMLSKDRT